MDGLVVLASAQKHGLSRESIIEAWGNFVGKRPRGEDVWVVVGLDFRGREIEMVGLVTADGRTLVIHALSPATRKIKKELGLE